MVSVIEKATEVRREFADFLDDAQRRPKFMKRRRQQYVVLPAEMLDVMAPQTVQVSLLSDEDGTYFTDCPAVADVIGFGKSEQEALDSFAEGLVSFCYEYYDNFALYSAAPNRVAQLPLVTAVVSHYERSGSIADLITVV
jgi:hypothetical protein